MGNIEMEARPLYGIGTVARLTKIKSGTLRIWDRRYGLGASYKSPSGRRMYTQTDLEHLQIIASLVDRGYRIGEIANMERKTLAALLDQAGAQPASNGQRLKALFTGDGLCEWLDQHQHLLSGLDARLLRQSFEGIEDGVGLEGYKPELLVISVGALSQIRFDRIERVRGQLGYPSTLVVYEFGNPHWIEQLAERGVSTLKGPLDSERFGVHIARLKQVIEIEQGNADAGDLAVLKPRLFTSDSLLQLKGVESVLPCGCTNHLAELIESLNHFETYSADCAVEGWSDAATHACVHAYVNQARFLVERALQSVLEEKQQHD
jgi:DNA-binding transcriptional MerR regulator